MLRKLFTLAAALSLVVCVTTALLSDASRGAGGIDRRIVRGGVQWRVTCRDGEVRVDNSPQREAEARRVEQERSRTRQESERELAPLRQTLEREPYGTEAYLRALEEFRRLKERGERAAARAGAEAEARRAPPTPEIVHVFRLRPIVGGAAVLPTAWLAAWAYRRWRRRRNPGGAPRSLRLVASLFRGRAALVSVPWLVLGLTVVTLWVRSETAIMDWLVYSARSPAHRSMTWATLRSIDGAISVAWLRRVYGTPQLYLGDDTTNPSSPGYMPGGPPLGWRYEARRISRTPNPRAADGQAASPAPRPLGYYVTTFWLRRGFSYQRRSGAAPPRPIGTPNTLESYCWVGMPHWFLLGLWAVPPLLVLRRRARAARRAALHLCPACGYDLRATPERCPECGTAAETGKGAAA